MKKRRRRRIVWGVLGVLLVFFAVVAGQPLVHLGLTAFRDVDELVPLPIGFVDDASRLNAVEVAEVWRKTADAATFERELAALLQRARGEGRRVSIAGARHSMGGHTSYPGGIVIDMTTHNKMSFDSDADLLTVEAGAMWCDVIAYLDQYGRSVAVMQSDCSFSVGGSVSANCHGWQYDSPPIASTVESFRLMLADGSILRCSRTEASELFSLVLGGYGLFGIILDLDLRVVPNEAYRIERYVMKSDELVGRMPELIASQPKVQMIYGRMEVSPESFLENLQLSLCIPDAAAEVPALSQPGLRGLRRAVFRGSVHSDYGKRLRWRAETEVGPIVERSVVSRNTLLSEGVEVFQNRRADTTDVLHEYFVPTNRFADFVEQLQAIIPEHQGELLNVTIRFVKEDHDTKLRYATSDVVALVMLFVQDRTPTGEARMAEMTRSLIDAAIDCEGRYYLPYRLHASLEQFRSAYPEADDFFAAKRRYDPSELLQNHFYLKYGAPQ